MEAFVRGQGGQGPSLVYVPGIDATGEFLLGTRERLEHRFHVVRVGYRSTGRPWEDRSGDPSARHLELARSVDRLVARLGHERVLVLTESFGGGVSLAWALEAPARVRGLAIVNSFAHFSKHGEIRRVRALAALLPQGLFRLGRRLLGRWILLHPRRDPEAWRRFLALEPTRFDAAYRERLDMIATLDLRPRLPSISCPVFLYAADRDQVVASVPEAQEMASLLPRGRVTVLPSAGHFVLPLGEEPWVERMEELDRAAMN